MRAGVDAYNRLPLGGVLRARPRPARRHGADRLDRRRRRRRHAAQGQGDGASRASSSRAGPRAATPSPTTTTRSGRRPPTRGCRSASTSTSSAGPPASARRAAAAQARRAPLYGDRRQGVEGQRQGGRRARRRVRHGAGHHRPADLHRRVRALPGPPRRDDRDGRRLDPALPRADGRPLLAQPLVGQHPDHASRRRFYWYRNMSATFIIDRCGIANRHGVGVDNMMWSTDYPHHGNDWPYCRKVDQRRHGRRARRREAPASSPATPCASSGSADRGTGGRR